MSQYSLEEFLMFPKSLDPNTVSTEARKISEKRWTEIKPAFIKQVEKAIDSLPKGINDAIQNAVEQSKNNLSNLSKTDTDHVKDTVRKAIKVHDKSSIVKGIIDMIEKDQKKKGVPLLTYNGKMIQQVMGSSTMIRNILTALLPPVGAIFSLINNSQLWISGDLQERAKDMGKMKVKGQKLFKLKWEHPLIKFLKHMSEHEFQIHEDTLLIVPCFKIDDSIAEKEARKDQKMKEKEQKRKEKEKAKK